MYRNVGSNEKLPAASHEDDGAMFGDQSSFWAGPGSKISESKAYFAGRKKPLPPMAHVKGLQRMGRW
jgi:hypothetical protein